MDPIGAASPSLSEISRAAVVFLFAYVTYFSLAYFPFVAWLLR